MSATPELESFIKDAVKAGKRHEEIEGILLQAGWDKERVTTALRRFYKADFPVAIPLPQAYASPRLFFLNLFYFVLLYLLVYNVTSILFTMLDHYLPDGLGQYNRGFYYVPSIRNALQDNLSVILVGMPMLFLTGRTIRRAMASTRQSIPRIRLKLVYLTMFIGACTVLSSACCFVYFFLRGEISIRFVIKVAILTATVAGLYLHYAAELKRDEENA